MMFEEVQWPVYGRAIFGYEFVLWVLSLFLRSGPAGLVYRLSGVTGLWLSSLQVIVGYFLLGYRVSQLDWMKC